ncbi:DUF5134 domain-containing protein [Streptomyces sp. HNM0645]|uniref:DUF5134 domain-containing protein n=1 Tax=Streptomyces sp. HNM0645 TaxID=2782343 RepID=UPI0024B6AE26|nr:DUF5134 domain-containing protein [Streptomyces sp. HNM0645]MDI9887069.1 DUF5134 domain-containing protein [Streptomyces sp. HNM0645]
MHGPAVPGWLLVALCAMSGAYCVVRMRCCAGPARSAATDEALMGFGMAAMAVPAAVAPAPEWAWLPYAVLFGTVGLRALRATRASRAGAHHLHHLVGSLAMVYMAVTMSPFAAGGHGEHGAPGAGGVPLVTGALLVYFTVFVLHTGARLVPAAAPAGGPPPAWGARPELALACRVSMGVAMVAMLLSV